MASVEEFVNKYEVRLRSVNEVIELLKTLSDDLDLLYKIRSQAADIGLEKLSVIEGLRQLFFLNEEELLDVDKVRKAHSLVSKICRDAMLEVLSKIIGHKVEAWSTDYRELYSVFSEFIDLYKRLKHKETIMELISYNISTSNVKLEEIIRVKKQLLEVDRVLEEIASIDMRIMGVDFHALVEARLRETHLSELEKLSLLVRLLKDIAQIKSPAKIRCEAFSSIIVRKWCEEYIKSIDEFEKKLRDIIKLLRELDLSNLEKLKKKYSEVIKTLENLKNYENELIHRAKKIVKTSLSGKIDEVLKSVDEHVRHERLNQLQQLILEMLARERVMEMPRLLEDLQKSAHCSLEEILRAVYDLNVRGIISCTVRL